MIPLTSPDLGPDEIDAVAAVLRSGRLAQGVRVEELERRWADFIGTRHAVAVANVTVALLAIHAGLGHGPGDEVITVSHAYPGTVSAILATGATPVFVDIEPDTFLIDAKRIEAAITPRTRAICPVHRYGLPADMDMIRAIADRHGLAVVEDAGPADGAAFRGRRVGASATARHGCTRRTTSRPVMAAWSRPTTTGWPGWNRAYRHAGPRPAALATSWAWTTGSARCRPRSGWCAWGAWRRRRRVDGSSPGATAGARRPAAADAGDADGPEPCVPPVRGGCRAWARSSPRSYCPRASRSGRSRRCRCIGSPTWRSAGSKRSCRSRTRRSRPRWHCNSTPISTSAIRMSHRGAPDRVVTSRSQRRLRGVDGRGELIRPRWMACVAGFPRAITLLASSPIEVVRQP